MFRLIKKLKLLTQSLYLSIFYFFKSIFSHDKLNGGNDKFVVSLTTYGWRYNFVFLTIESLISQSTKPSAIILWVYTGDKPSHFAGWILKRQSKRGLIIKIVEQDVRSYKKLSFILRDIPPQIDFVVTADDDVFYPKNWLKQFAENESVHNKILCYRGRIITLDQHTEKLIPYKNWPLATPQHNNTMNILPTGVSGICYPLKSLDTRLADFSSIINLCPYADDIWFKLLTLSNGYEAVILDSPNSHYPPVITSLTKGLEKINVNGDMNIKQFENSMVYFDLDYSLFKKEF